MALALNDRVQQTGTANTTVSFTLSGSVTGFQSFAVVGNGNTTYYSSTDASALAPHFISKRKQSLNKESRTLNCQRRFTLYFTTCSIGGPRRPSKRRM
jgi:hypothetical protein